MFWNSDPQRVYGRFLKASGLDAGNALIQLDGGWAGFMETLPSDDTLAGMGHSDIAEHAGCDPVVFGEALPAALRHWRVSPSRSMVNMIGDVGDCLPGNPMFRDLKTQTRVLASAIEAGAVVERALNGVAGENRALLKVSQDANAMTAVGEAAAAINRLARALKVWEERNKALVRTGAVKLPKALYRGVRGRDVPLPNAADVPEGDEWNFRACEIMAARADLLASRPLAEISHADILSFTANERIAEYFTKDEGHVVAVDPAELSLVSSWATDETLSGKDYVTGRQEREWIMRVGAFMPSPDQVRIHDRHVAWSMADPRGVAMLDGTATASYEMDGHRVEAQFVWNQAGTNGTIRFRIDGRMSETRAEAKRLFGFDPMPSPDSVTSDLSFREHVSFASRAGRKYAPWERTREREPAPGM